METAAAVEIEKGCLRRFSLEDFHRCLKKSSQKPLRLFHSYHRPDGGDYDNKVNFSETAIHLKVASFWSEEWGAPQGAPQPQGVRAGATNFICSAQGCVATRTAIASLIYSYYPKTTRWCHIYYRAGADCIGW